MPLTESFRAYAEALLFLHRLVQHNEGTSENAEQIRDVMDGLWSQMTVQDQAVARSLAADLTESYAPQRELEKPTMTRHRKLLAAMELTVKQEDWDSALLLVRQADRFLPAAALSHIRGRAWFNSGFAELAVVFFERAVRLDPQKPLYGYVLLDALSRSSKRHEAMNQAEAILANPSQFDPLLVTKAADIVYVSTRTMESQEAQKVYGQLVEIYEQTIPRLRQHEQYSAILVHSFVLQGMCFEALNRGQEAANAYTSAIAIAPNSEAALTARGLLLYGINVQAVVDLQAARKAGTDLVWPTLFLAHDAISRGDYPTAERLARNALTLKPSPSAAAELFEWLAIARSSLDANPAEVQQLFERALELAPESDRIRKNFRAFIASLEQIQPIRNWVLEPRAAVRDFGRHEFHHEFALARAA